MRRTLATEWLDELPAADAKAQRSRRDLQLVNRLMGNARLLRRALTRSGALDWADQIVELGAGDGTLLWQVLRPARIGSRTISLNRGRAGFHPGPLFPERMGAGGTAPSHEDTLKRGRRARPLKIVLVDCQQLVTPATRSALEQLGYEVEVVTADALQWLRASRNEGKAVFLANLFLHHCEESRLRELFELIAARSRLFLACEPRRAAVPLAASRLLGLLGCNAVTRHDAAISVRAGFKGRELASLWPQEQVWSVREDEAGLFSHVFAATRRAGSGFNPGQGSR